MSDSLHLNPLPEPPEHRAGDIITVTRVRHDTREVYVVDKPGRTLVLKRLWNRLFDGRMGE